MTWEARVLIHTQFPDIRVNVRHRRVFTIEAPNFLEAVEQAETIREEDEQLVSVQLVNKTQIDHGYR